MSEHWLNKVIPEQFCDVDCLIEEALFEGLIFFWEQDNGEVSLRYNADPANFPETDGPFAFDDKRKVLYEAMKEAYEWAITRKEIDVGSHTAEEYKKWDEDREKFATSIFAHRKSLWT